MHFLNTKETIFLKGIKLHKIYSFKHVGFETFYQKFKNTRLYKSKSILMAFFALYGCDYSIPQVENIILNDAINLCYKIGINPFGELNYFNDIFEAVIGELRIVPIGVIEDGQYILKIQYEEVK